MQQAGRRVMGRAVLWRTDGGIEVVDVAGESTSPAKLVRPSEDRFATVNPVVYNREKETLRLSKRKVDDAALKKTRDKQRAQRNAAANARSEAQKLLDEAQGAGSRAGTAPEDDEFDNRTADGSLGSADTSVVSLSMLDRYSVPFPDADRFGGSQSGAGDVAFSMMSRSTCPRSSAFPTKHRVGGLQPKPIEKVRLGASKVFIPRPAH